MNFIEEFRVIDNYDGKYKVSNKGNIFCKPNPWNETGVMKTRLIQGYKSVGLRRFDGEKSIQTIHKIHRLVAEYFIPNPESKPCVNHIDGNKLNNNVSNLEWVTVQENTIHSYKNKLQRNWWTKELGEVAINLVIIYEYNFADVAELFNLPSRSNVFHFFKKGYKTFGLRMPRYKVKKHSNKLDLSESYTKYIKCLLYNNTVLS